MRLFSTAILLLLISCSPKVQTAGNNKAVSKEVASWYNSKQWLNGWNVAPHATLDQAAFSESYHAHPDRWQKAFDFLAKTDLASLKPGRIPIDGDVVYAIVTDGPLKKMEASSYEAHKHYADIQYVINGSEQIGVAPFEGATEKVAYDPAKDIAFYDANGQFYKATPQTFFIFFAEKDAHRPGVASAESDHDKKLVVKVKTD